jgi:NAD(P)-dependent dehydrogenase (short-subunit alcohol dehydrogenase family)
MAADFEGKVALVTGAGSGMGRAAALRFAAAGAKVTVADIDASGGGETVRLITEAGGEAMATHTDVSRADDVRAMVAATVQRWGRLDCAFNNAGITSGGRSILDCDEETWNRVLGINLTGVWLCMKYELPELLRAGGGAIVNTASSFGEVGAPNSSPYTASKHGVVGITKAVALEVAQQGVRVNAVLPGLTDTPILGDQTPERQAGFLAAQPIGRMGRAEEVAAAAVWLCSDEATFVVGHPMAVDGGYLAR